VGALVPRALADLGLEDAAAAWRLGECWDAAVGPEIARHCRPAGLRDGPRGRVLEAEVASSVWAQQLVLRRDEILSGLRRELGDEAPTDVRFRVGYPAAPGRRT
jgi:predicted nucleic acid-binding Zn ribbon protein